MPAADIVIRGAREHNLRDVSLELPRNKLIVMTGPYQIEESGKQVSMEFIVMQNQESGSEVIFPKEVATSKAMYPVPAFSAR